MALNLGIISYNANIANELQKGQLTICGFMLLRNNRTQKMLKVRIHRVEWLLGNHLLITNTRSKLTVGKSFRDSYIQTILNYDQLSLLKCVA